MSADGERSLAQIALHINQHQREVNELNRNAQNINSIQPPPPLSSTSRFSRPRVEVFNPLLPQSCEKNPLPLRPDITSLYVLERYIKKAIRCQDNELIFYLLPRAPACSVRRILHWAKRKRRPEVDEFLLAVARAVGFPQNSTSSGEPIPCNCFVHAMPDVGITFLEDREYDRLPVPIQRTDLTDVQDDLLTAISDMDFAKVADILIPLNYRDVRNLLMYTVELEKCAVLSTLAYAIDLDKSDGGLLVYTIHRGLPEHLRQLLHAGFPANCPVFDDLPVLMLKMPSLQHYHTLLKMGADPNLRYEKNDSLVKTAFMAAMMRGDVKLMEMLLDYGAVIDDVVGKSDFVFELACTPHFNVSLISLLLDHGLDINVCDKHGETLVHAAVLHSNYELMCLLIERGADVNIADRDGVTPLIRSARMGKMFTDRLLEGGADINAVDRWRRNVLVSWMFESKEKVVVELLNRGASCDLRSDDWGTPLILSMRLSLPFNKVLDKILHKMSSNETAKRDFMDYQAVGIPSALCQAVVDMCQGITRSKRTVEILLQHGASCDKDPDLKDALIHAIVFMGDFRTFQAALNRYIKPRDCSVQRLRSCLDMPIVSCCTDKVSPLYVALYFGYWPLAKFMLNIHYLTPSDTRKIAGRSCLYEHLAKFACEKSLEVLEDFQKELLPLEVLTLIKVSSAFPRASLQDIKQLNLPEPVRSLLVYDYDLKAATDLMVLRRSERSNIHGVDESYICPCPIKGPFF